MPDPAQIQRAYYEETAQSYDESHAEREHVVALHYLAAFIELHDIRSVLDVGAGTGRAMRFLKVRFPDLVVKGIEPVEGLRRIGHHNGIPEGDLVDGDGTRLPFADGAFDLVVEFAVLHHVPKPQNVVAEMIRVAGKGVAISDANFMGQGSRPVRFLKFALYKLGLWPLANFVKTRGRRYTISEGDGLAYSYTVYQNLGQLRRAFPSVRLLSTSGVDGDIGLMTTAPHLLVIAHRAQGRDEDGYI